MKIFKILLLCLLPYLATAQTSGGINPIIFYRGTTATTPATNTTDQIMRSGGIGLGLPNGSAVQAKLDVKGTVRFQYYNNAIVATDSVVIVRSNGFLGKTSKASISTKIVATLQAVPTLTGNTANLNSIFLAVDGIVYFVDAGGRGIALSPPPTIEVIRSATPLTGAPPLGATLGYDYNAGVLYFKNALQVWEALPIVTSVSNSTAGNSLTTTVNGVTGAPQQIVQSVSNSSTANSLATTVNGVTGTAVQLVNSNSLVYTYGSINGSLVSTVNGVGASAINIPSGNNTSVTNDNNNHLSVTDFGGTKTADIVTTVSLGSGVNNMTLNVNGVTDATTPIINSTSLVNTGSNTLHTVVNGVQSTDAAIVTSVSNAYDTTTGNLTTTVNGVTGTAVVIPSHVPFALTTGNSPFAYNLATQTANVPQSAALVDNTNATFSFLKGDGSAVQNVDCRVATVVNNANGTGTITDDFGTSVPFRTNETLTTLVLNGSNLDYTDETGTLNTIPLPASTNWLLGGNSGLTDLVDNMIGTKDAAPLVFWQNDLEVGRIDGAQTALGAGATATGGGATAIGTNATATGGGATAIGESTATGKTSTAIGGGSYATEYNATAIGHETQAVAESATAIGNFAVAYSYNEIQLQQGTSYTPISINTWEPTDRQLNLGSYNNTANILSDIFTILKNGKTAIGGFDNFETTTNPAQLQVNGSIASNTIISAAYLGSNANGEIIAVAAPVATLTGINQYKQFTATAAQTAFTLPTTPLTGSDVVMYRNGVSQSNTTYTVTGTAVTYTGVALTIGDRINFQYTK